MFTRTRAGLVLCGGLAGAGALSARSALADGADSLAPPTAVSSPKLDTTPSTFSLKLQGRGEYNFESGLDSGEGEVSIARAGVAATLDFLIGTSSHLSFTWDSEFSWYDWKKASEFSKSASDPWDDTVVHSFGARLFVPETEHWGWFVGGGGQASYEREASFGDSLVYAGQGGVRYQFNKDFALTGGLAVRSRLEHGIEVLPIIGLDWNINDKFTLSTQRGTGLMLKYQATDAIAFTLDGGYENREFRLRDDGPTTGGVGADRRVPVALGVIWTIAPTVSLSARAGVVAWSHYKLEDDDGRRISETDGDAAAMLSVSLDFKF